MTELLVLPVRPVLRRCRCCRCCRAPALADRCVHGFRVGAHLLGCWPQVTTV